MIDGRMTYTAAEDPDNDDALSAVDLDDIHDNIDNIDPRRRSESSGIVPDRFATDSGIYPDRLVRSDSHYWQGEELAAVDANVTVYHLLRFAVGVLIAFPWPMLFAFIVDALTQMAPTVAAIFAIGCVLLLTQQAFESIGRFLAELAGPEFLPMAVCFGTIVSQTLVIGGGFYRTVPPVVSAASPIRYSFAAISMLTFSADDSFFCTPERALAARGVTWCPIEVCASIPCFPRI